MLDAAESTLMRRAWRQSGVVTAAQAHRAGLSADSVHRRVSAGQWERVYPCTYRVLVIPAGPSTQLWSAALSVPEAVVSGPSAAWWWGLIPGECPPPQLDVPVSTRLNRPGVRLVRRRVAVGDRRVRRGLTVVTLPLAVLQSLDQPGVDSAGLLDEALRSATLTNLGRTLVDHRGEHGMRVAARWLDRAADGARSEAERLAIRWLREAEITGWRANHRVGRAVVDLAWPSKRLAVEIDGAAWHTTRQRFEVDRSRQNQLVLARWTVLRFTWEQLEAAPHRFVAEVRRALGQ